MNDTDISQQMLRDGAAWHVPLQVSRQEQSEYERYALTEAAAKTEKLGVWSIPQLRPAWDFRADAREKTDSQDRKYTGTNAPARPVAKGKPGRWGDTNPRLGNIGALVNGYNAETKTGYFGTSLLGIDVEKDAAADQRTAIDVTYFYKEEDKIGRKGIFVVTIVVLSNKWNFLSSNDLIITGDGKTTNIGKAKRTALKYGDSFRENLAYEVSRSTIDRIVNDENVLLKVGDHLIHLTGLKFMLYNMLQLSK